MLSSYVLRQHGAWQGDHVRVATFFKHNHDANQVGTLVVVPKTWFRYND